jgi:hypothetical protein
MESPAWRNTGLCRKNLTQITVNSYINLNFVFKLITMGQLKRNI